jgi:BlaI family transcriptional regulator, penicillinase repressor
VHEPPLPTEAELRILRVLWDHGPSTVREVLTRLPGEEEAGYTTVLKLLQIMHVKGLVERDEANRTHVYQAAVPPESTQRRLVADLVERAFGGSSHQLVLQALSPQLSTPAELARVRELLDTLGPREDA